MIRFEVIRFRFEAVRKELDGLTMTGAVLRARGRRPPGKVGMEVKGTAFLARKVMLLEEIGEERYTAFLADYARKDPFFGDAIVATTLIPIDRFIAFNEALIDEFYAGDRATYYRFGEKNAEYSLMMGPHKRIRDTNSIAVFVESARFIYQSYYTAGRAEGSLAGDVADLRLHGVPPEHRHIYLEFASAAYVRRGMELISLRAVSMACVQGFSRGDDEVHYRYTVERTPAPGPFSLRRKASCA